MPIVFVHGVNNRKNEIYRKNEFIRNAFLQEIVAPALNITAGKVKIINPYWGDKGVNFAWDMAVLPEQEAKIETFGGNSTNEDIEHISAILTSYHLDNKLSLVKNAQQNLISVVDSIYESAIIGTISEEEARLLAHAYLRASIYTEKNPSPEWLENAKDSNFIDLLCYHSLPSSEESFGTNETLNILKDATSRVITTLTNKTSSFAVNRFRNRINTLIANFAGDAFTYLTNRGDNDKEGSIIEIVRAALNDAVNNKTPDDDKIIIIAHSFGGEIIHDVLTHFEPTLQVDYLITVGSQVGLFEEMKLYIESDSTITKKSEVNKIKKNEKIKNWLNVIDLNDVLSFKVEPVFTGALDYIYDSNNNIFNAHSNYFMKPDFYKRLACRLKQQG